MPKRNAYVTLGIAAVTTIVWLLTAVTGNDRVAAIAFGLIPARLSGIVELPGAAPAWLTPLTAALVHDGFLHIGFNMLVLVVCGMQIERALGRVPLVVLYLVGAFAAGLAQWAAMPSSITPMVGASGAVSAIVGAYALSFGRPRRVTNSLRTNRWLNIAWLLAAWVVIQLLVGFAAEREGIIIATAAHIGGFIAGLMLQRPLLLWQYRKA